MKQWIARQWAAYAEVTGRPVPQWVRKLVGPETSESFAARERSLTEALRKDSPPAPETPPNLAADIRRALYREEAVPPATRLSGSWMMPLTAAAAALLLGLFLWQGMEQPTGPESSELAALTREYGSSSADSVNTLMEARLPHLPKGEDVEEMLLQPLVQEQAYLASDLTNAALFVAENVVPSEYLQRVRSRFSMMELKVE